MSEAPMYHPPGGGPPRQDRRARPTPILSRYTFLGGRRRGPAHVSQREGTFVDLYSTRLVVLLLIFYTFTVFDSVATLFYLRKGGEELNPIAKWMIEQGNIEFVLIKGGLTAICVLFVMLHKNFRYARVSIAVGFAFYAALTLYHIFLQIHAWEVAPRF